MRVQLRRLLSRRVVVPLVLAITVGIGGLPALAAAPQRRVPHYLVFSATYGFRHDGIQEAVGVLRYLSRITGSFTLEWSEDAAVLSPATYRRVDGVIMLQTTGTGGGPLTDKQKTDFLTFFGCGGAYVGVHAAADFGDWPEYEKLIGASFEMHPHFDFEENSNPVDSDLLASKAISEVSVIVEDQKHIATTPWHGVPYFRTMDELYRWKTDPRERVKVLLSLDEQTHYWPRDIRPAGPTVIIPVPEEIPNPVQLFPPLAYPHHSPLAWTKSYGRGRVFYTNLGHAMRTWDRADYRQHLLGGIEWAAQQRPDQGCVRARIR